MGDDDPRSNIFAPVQWVLCVGFSWQMVQTCVIRLRGKRLKHACSNCVLYILFILSGGPNKCWLHTCDACVITNKRFCGLLLSPATKNICCHWIRKPKFNNVCVLFKTSKFCSRMLKMYSKGPDFKTALQKLGARIFCLCLLQRFCHLLKTLLKTLITHDYIHSKRK